MKTLRMIGMALFAVLMCVNFTSCSNEEVIPDEPTQDKYITVGLNCVGEYLNVTDSPLSRLLRGEFYLIQVYSLEEKKQENGNTQTVSTPYANGIFYGSLDGLTIKLLKGKKYKFQVAIDTNGLYNFTVNESFIYSAYSFNPYYPLLQGYRKLSVDAEVFYGELDEYTAEEEKNVNISTKRVSYAAKFVAENLSEGTLKINVKKTGANASDYDNNIELTPTNLISDKIYSFNDVYNAWKGIKVETGNYDSETGKPIYEYKDYSCEKIVTILWQKSEDQIYPLGNYKVTFKRNVKTTIRIQANKIPVGNGITVSKEETAFSDDENEYEISGGEIVEVPVNSEP